jgi:hypothetical protein
MKRLLIFLSLLFFFVPFAHAGVVQHTNCVAGYGGATCAGFTGVGTSASLAYPSNTTTGNLLVIYVEIAFQTSLSVTDSQGNTLVQGASGFDGTWNFYIYYLINCPGGADTVTVGAGSFYQMVIAEYPPVTGTTGTPAPGSGTGTSGAVGPITPTVANNITVAFFKANVNGMTFSSPTGGFTITDSGGGANANRVLLDLTQTSATAASAGVTFSSSCNWNALIMSFGSPGGVVATQIGGFLTGP